MSSEAKGHLFVVAAPSGAGKTSLVNALLERDSNLVISVSHTTRDPRPGEQNGQHYHFISDQAFRDLLDADAFLEHALVFGHHYGTHRGTTLALLAQGRDVILEIDWQGARQIRSRFPDCHSIFILPPSVQALRHRLSQRGQDSQAVIERRMAEARQEISHASEFDFQVVNDDFEAALDELAGIVRNCREGNAIQSAQYVHLLAELMEIG